MLCTLWLLVYLPICTLACDIHHLSMGKEEFGVSLRGMHYGVGGLRLLLSGRPTEPSLFEGLCTAGELFTVSVGNTARISSVLAWSRAVFQSYLLVCISIPTLSCSMYISPCILQIFHNGQLYKTLLESYFIQQRQGSSTRQCMDGEGGREVKMGLHQSVYTKLTKLNPHYQVQPHHLDRSAMESHPSTSRSPNVCCVDFALTSCCGPAALSKILIKRSFIEYLMEPHTIPK